MAESDLGIFISDEINSLTIASAQNSKQFSLIKKEMGETYLQVAISKIFKEALRFLPHKLNQDDMVYFSKYFSKELWHWKFDDFILCFKNGIDKKYSQRIRGEAGGDLYPDFNITVFMKWVEFYESDKEAHFYNKHLDIKESPTTTEVNKQNIFKERMKYSPNLSDIEIPKQINKISHEEYFGITAEEIKKRANT